MFERITGFFRRFRSKRKTSETAMLGPDEGGFDDEFGLDDSEFGEAIGTEELGAESLDADFSPEGGDAFDSGGGDAFDSGDGDLDAFDSGGDAGGSLSAMDTFETMADSQPSDPGTGSLAGGSGEGLLDDSLGQAGTFESLGGFEDTAPSDSDDFGEEIEGFDEGFGSESPGGELDEELGDMAAPGPAEPARVRIPVVAGALVGGLLVGAVVGLFVVPMLTGGSDGVPLDAQIAKVQSDLRKAERELSDYNALGGLGAIEQLRVDLEAAQARFASIEDLGVAVDEARAREQAYDAVLQEAAEAERSRQEHNAAREALTEQIAEAEVRLAEQRAAVGVALLDYQRARQASEVSVVVAQAFEAAEERYVRERVEQMLSRVGAGAPAGE